MRTVFVLRPAVGTRPPSAPFAHPSSTVATPTHTMNHARYYNFLAGSWTSGAPRTVLNPATGLAVTTVSLASVDHVHTACDAAQAAQKTWSKLPGRERAAVLRRWAASLLGRRDEIAMTLALETGKSLHDCQQEVTQAAQAARYHTEWAHRIGGEVLPSDHPGEHIFTQCAPLGVIAMFVPSNNPIYTLVRKLAPALIAGNAVVVRVSQYTPASALELAKTLELAALPKGLVSILHMEYAAASALCTHAHVAMLSLSGMPHTGRVMIGHSQTHFARLALELAGKTPAIVMPGSDLDAAASAIVQSRLRHSGQSYVGVERVYVHEAVHDTFIKLVLQRMESLRVGDRNRNPDFVGPLQTQQGRMRVHALVEAAVQHGAQLLCGGYIPDTPGFFYPPTLLAQVTQQSPVIQEIIFGPVLPVVKVGSFDAALALANDHTQGLAAAVFTENYHHVLRASHELEAGEVYINRAPLDLEQNHHSGWKHSGMGSTGQGRHSVLTYTQTRLVTQPYRPTAI